VIIALRTATVTAADHIAVLEAGTLTASGTHDELLETSTLYRNLAATQLSGAH